MTHGQGVGLVCARLWAEARHTSAEPSLTAQGHPWMSWAGKWVKLAFRSAAETQSILNSSLLRGQSPRGRQSLGAGAEATGMIAGRPSPFNSAFLAGSRPY